MRAFVVTGPGRAEVTDVDPPAAGPGEVVVDVERVGVCGTDVEFFTGRMAYLRSGDASYPMRLGHEWCGRVSAVGEGVDLSWLGRRVTGDTMLGCGRCARCTDGRQHLCADRFEIGVRRGWPGALAEQLPVPVTALHPLPDSVDAVVGALVEPGGNALRAAEATACVAGSRVLVWGPGTIGLLAVQFALAAGLEVHVVGRSQPRLALARDLGAHGVWTAQTLPDQPYAAIVDATSAPGAPQWALTRVEPGGRVVYIGIAGEPSTIDTRDLVLKDVTAVGILSASPRMAATIDTYASGRIDPHPVVGATVGLDDVADVLAGRREAGSAAPKVHVDPRR